MDANNPVASNTAQQDSDDEVKSVEERYRLRLQKAVAEIRTAKASDPRATIVEGRDLVLLLPLALAAPRVAKAKQDAVAELTAQAENARNDKQTGSGSSSSGSTALVTKGAVPAIFGFAVENGALTRTDSGTTVTKPTRDLRELCAILLSACRSIRAGVIRTESSRPESNSSRIFLFDTTS
jgi:hypothetical protein